MTHPYSKLPPQCFWQTGVKGQSWAAIDRLYTKKFEITPQTKIMTAGSCFAQHVGRRLKESGFNVLDKEPAPRTLSRKDRTRFGYDLFSARYGNIYTIRQLWELILESTGRLKRAPLVWRKGEKFVDALRPNVEPEGLDSAEEVIALRNHHLRRVRTLLADADLLVFTFGLTEAWIHKPSGAVVPLVPGASAGGTFDPDLYAFKQFKYGEIIDDFLRVRQFLHRRNPQTKFIVTVSPVPLAATATGNHVLTATTYSKSVLRAVAGDLADQFDDIDYFPSYELITAPFSRQFFYEEDLREIDGEAIDMVMRTFLHEHAPNAVVAPHVKRKRSAEDIACEERLLGAFAR